MYGEILFHLMWQCVTFGFVMVGQLKFVKYIAGNHHRNEAPHEGEPDDVLPMPVEMKKENANKKDAKKQPEYNQEKATNFVDDSLLIFVLWNEWH